MTDYEKMRADISKHFKDEIENLKLEVIRLRNENTDLRVENFLLKKHTQEYKNKLDHISDSRKALLAMTETINNLI